jgi:hypothetical protein
MTWPEEVQTLPKGWGPGDPFLFLLSDGTDYYVYRFDCCEALLNAGPSLDGVFEGLRKRRWDAPKWKEWSIVADDGVEYDCDVDYYFPRWRGGGNAPWELIDSLREFTPIEP